MSSRMNQSDYFTTPYMYSVNGNKVSSVTAISKKLKYIITEYYLDCTLTFLHERICLNVVSADCKYTMAVPIECPNGIAEKTTI